MNDMKYLRIVYCTLRFASRWEINRNEIEKGRDEKSLHLRYEKQQQQYEEDERKSTIMRSFEVFFLLM